MPSRHSDLPYRPCVGIMVLNPGGKVWMGHRPIRNGNDEFKPDEKRWQMPQGGIDKGEKPLAAAKRELWEETGITSARLLAQSDEWLTYDLPDQLIGVALKGKFCGQRQKWFAFGFEGDDSEINIANPPNGAPVEFDQWQWVSMAEVTARIVEFKRPVYEQVAKMFKHLEDA